MLMFGYLDYRLLAFLITGFTLIQSHLPGREDPDAIASHGVVEEGRSIINTELKRFDAMVEKDFQALDELINKELYYLHSNGNVDTKESFIAALQDGSRSYDSISMDTSNARIYGTVGIINGKCTYYRTDENGKENNLRLHYTSVYAHLDDRWQHVSWQSYRLP